MPDGSSPDVGLQIRLRENGDAAAFVASKLRSILDDPRLTVETLDELLLGIGSRCIEIEDLVLSLCRSNADEVTKRVARRIEGLWREMARLVAERAKHRSAD